VAHQRDSVLVGHVGLKSDAPLPLGRRFASLSGIALAVSSALGYFGLMYTGEGSGNP